jgi:hypothetical protein
VCRLKSDAVRTSPRDGRRPESAQFSPIAAAEVAIGEASAFGRASPRRRIQQAGEP